MMYDTRVVRTVLYALTDEPDHDLRLALLEWISEWANKAREDEIAREERQNRMRLVRWGGTRGDAATKQIHDIGQDV